MTVDLFDKTEASELDDDQLAERVVGYASQIAALTSRMLDYLAEFDARGAWRGQGIASCAQWLVWRAGLSLRTAQEHVRVATALRDLPQIHDEFAAGKLSFSKVRAMARIATPEREEELISFARAASARQVEKLCGAIRDCDEKWQAFLDDGGDPGDSAAFEEFEPPPPESWGRFRWGEQGCLVVNLKLNPNDGARFLAGLVRAEYERTRTDDDPDLPIEGDAPSEGRLPADGERPVQSHSRDLWRNVPGNIAPSLIAMADLALNEVRMPQVAAGAEILVHQVDDETTLDEGPSLRDEERQEFECGATIREVGHEEADESTAVATVGSHRMGPLLRWGRKRRVPNAALVRTILMRDRTCQAPGCGRTRHLHIHHVKPWSEGGTTDPDNLILLCGSHHRALHHGAFTISALGHQRFAFRGTHGGLLVTAPLHAAPPNWHPDMRVVSDGVTTVGGGSVDYPYAVDVLYQAWAWRARQNEQQPPAAAA